MSDYQESFFVNLRPRTLMHIEKKLAELAETLPDEFEDPQIVKEIVELELEIRARLQRIAKGDVQR